jgi:hypothetical protein
MLNSFRGLPRLPVRTFFGRPRPLFIITGISSPFSSSTRVSPSASRSQVSVCLSSFCVSGALNSMTFSGFFLKISSSMKSVKSFSA